MESYLYPEKIFSVDSRKINSAPWGAHCPMSEPRDVLGVLLIVSEALEVGWMQ